MSHIQWFLCLHLTLKAKMFTSQLGFLEPEVTPSCWASVGAGVISPICTRRKAFCGVGRGQTDVLPQWQREHIVFQEHLHYKCNILWLKAKAVEDGVLPSSLKYSLSFLFSLLHTNFACTPNGNGRRLPVILVIVLGSQYPENVTLSWCCKCSPRSFTPPFFQKGCASATGWQ